LLQLNFIVKKKELKKPKAIKRLASKHSGEESPSSNKGSAPNNDSLFDIKKMGTFKANNPIAELDDDESNEDQPIDERKRPYKI